MFRPPQQQSASESSEDYPSGSPIYVSGLFGYIIGGTHHLILLK